MAEHTDTPAEPLGEAWLEHSATKEQLQFFEDEGTTGSPFILAMALNIL